MIKKVMILILSLMTAYTLISAGYGLWEKKLVIKGRINVIKKDMEFEDGMVPAGMPRSEKTDSAEITGMGEGSSSGEDKERKNEERINPDGTEVQINEEKLDNRQSEHMADEEPDASDNTDGEKSDTSQRDNAPEVLKEQESPDVSEMIFPASAQETEKTEMTD